jgi:G3E family GTPase
MAFADRVPLSIVTGFLGSGKTTLIAALLRQPAMRGTAIIVNEIGAVGIDDAIIAEAVKDENIFLLKNGCLCCDKSNDLAATLLTLMRSSSEPLRQILIETSGLADPTILLQRLMIDPRVRDSVRLDAVIATVDGVNGLATLDDQPLAAKQAGVADRRLVTKADIADPRHLEELSQRLSLLNPGAETRTISHGAIQASEILGVSLYDPQQRVARLDRWLNLESYQSRMSRPSSDTKSFIQSSGRHVHDTSVRTWLIEHPGQVHWEVLASLLEHIIAKFGAAMLRVKGVIWTIGDDRPLVIHGVQRLFHTPVRITRWPSSPRCSIVLIGDVRAGAEAASQLFAEALSAATVDPAPSLGLCAYHAEG